MIALFYVRPPLAMLRWFIHTSKATDQCNVQDAMAGKTLTCFELGNIVIALFACQHTASYGKGIFGENYGYC